MTEWRVVTGRGHEVFVRERAGEWSARIPLFGPAYYAVEGPHPAHWPVPLGDSLQLIPPPHLTPADPGYPPGGVVNLEQVRSIAIVATA